MRQNNKDILIKATRRGFLKAVGLGAVALSGIGCDRRSETDVASKPNIVLIMADDSMGALCIKDQITPNIDRMATEGVSFKTCYATPVCQPTRVEIISGKYGCRTGITNLGNSYGWNPGYSIKDENNFARSLKAAGYSTAMAGKWHMTGTIEDASQVGFGEHCLWATDAKDMGSVLKKNNYKGKVYGDGPSRYWHPAIIQNGTFLNTDENDYGPDIFCDFVIDFMKQNNEKDKPFFAYYSMVMPHAVGSVKECSDPEFMRAEHLPPLPDIKNPGQRVDGGRENWHRYPEYVDDIVSRIEKAVNEMGISDNTYIIFTCDNGSGPKGDGKRSSTERGCWVPMVVKGPGVKKGLSSDALVDFTDIYPTLCEMAGAKVPVDVDGKSFVQALEGKPGKRDWIFAVHAGERIVRDRQWLLEENHETQFGRLWYCGDSRDGREGYKEVTDFNEPKALAAKERFVKILDKLPAEKGLPFRQYGNNPIYDKNKE